MNRTPEIWGEEQENILPHPRAGKESVCTLPSWQQLAFRVNIDFLNLGRGV